MKTMGEKHALSKKKLSKRKLNLYPFILPFNYFLKEIEPGVFDLIIFPIELFYLF